MSRKSLCQNLAAAALLAAFSVSAAHAVGQARGNAGSPALADGKAATVIIKVPHGSAPQVDGTLGKDEWADAARYPLARGGELFLKHDGKTLHVGIRGDAPAIASIAVLDGDRVRILHSSASLGTAVFLEDGEQWQPKQRFEWKCRGTRLDERLEKERQTYLTENGWLGSVIRMGDPNVAEITISRKLLAGKNPRIAVVNLPINRNPNEAASWWPSHLEDSCRDLGLLFGRSGSPLRFKPADWASLELVGKKPERKKK
jgi:hypothetical protein